MWFFAAKKNSRQQLSDVDLNGGFGEGRLTCRSWVFESRHEHWVAGGIVDDPRHRLRSVLPMTVNRDGCPFDPANAVEDPIDLTVLPRIHADDGDVRKLPGGVQYLDSDDRRVVGWVHQTEIAAVEIILAEKDQARGF